MKSATATVLITLEKNSQHVLNPHSHTNKHSEYNKCQRCQTFTHTQSRSLWAHLPEVLSSKSHAALSIFLAISYQIMLCIILHHNLVDVNSYAKC